MPQRQFNNHLSPEEMNRGVGMLESDVFRRVAKILNVSHSEITLDTNWHIKIVNFHFLTVKRI